MDSHLKDIIIYTYMHYRVPMQLGISRLMKLLFIADWEHISQFEERLGNFKWVVTPAGPFSVPALNILLKNKEYFDIQGKLDDWEKTNTNIAPEIVILFRPDSPSLPILHENATNVLNIVIDKTYAMNWQQLWQHMNLTTPLSVCELNKEVDLLDMLSNPAISVSPVLSAGIVRSTATKYSTEKPRTGKSGYVSKTSKLLLNRVKSN